MNLEELKSSIGNLNFYLDDPEFNEKLNLNDNIKKSFTDYFLNLSCNLFKFFRENGIPEIDFSLFDEKQLTSENGKSSDCYLKPVDYQLSFLLHLFLNYEKVKDLTLVNIIDTFLQKIKSSLKLTDIERTESGTVRCRTNIRFALNSLRNEGLINFVNSKHKRDWNLTTTGFLLSSFIVLAKPFPFRIIKQMLSDRYPVRKQFGNFDKLLKLLFSNDGFNNFVESIDGEEFDFMKTLCLKTTLLEIKMEANIKYQKTSSSNSGFDQFKYLKVINSTENNSAMEFLKKELSVLGNMRLLGEEALEILTGKNEE